MRDIWVRLLTICLGLALAHTPAAAGEPVELVSFNIRYGTADDKENAWPHRREMVTDLLAELDGDVVGVVGARRRSDEQATAGGERAGQSQRRVDDGVGAVERGARAAHGGEPLNASTSSS